MRRSLIAFALGLCAAAVLASCGTGQGGRRRAELDSVWDASRRYVVDRADAHRPERQAPCRREAHARAHEPRLGRAQGLRGQVHGRDRPVHAGRRLPHAGPLRLHGHGRIHRQGVHLSTGADRRLTTGGCGALVWGRGLVPGLGAGGGRDRPPPRGGRGECLCAASSLRAVALGERPPGYAKGGRTAALR